MKRAVVILSAIAALVGVPSATAMAGQPDAPSAACNTGTMHAHASVPETTGKGAPIEAHEHIPEAEGDECVHEAFA
jgi:hypothetical protein